jgi:hypothetical protein
MMVNRSLSHIATVLAALGTPAVIGAACAKSESAPVGVRADESAQATAAAPQQVVATATAVLSASASASAPGQVMMKGRMGGASGQASCGSGTCTADPKKK